MNTRMKVSETDEGKELQAQVDDLMRLLLAYRTGAVKEDHTL
jgi:fructose-1,6-bisphosphatase-3